VNQVPGNFVRVGVQRRDEVHFVSDGIGIPAAVADDVTSVIDSHQGPPTGYLYPATNELASPRGARSNETFVVIVHQLVEVCVTDLRYSFISSA